VKEPVESKQRAVCLHVELQDSYFC